MIPPVVRFTGLDIRPEELNRRVKGPIPLHWTRHQFLLEDDYVDPEWSMTSWINRNLTGRWTISSFHGLKGTIVVLGFENGNDAVMFRFLEGETAWRDNTSTAF